MPNTEKCHVFAACSSEPPHTRIGDDPHFCLFPTLERPLSRPPSSALIDNESVSMALPRGNDETPVARMVANSVMAAEFESRTRSWCPRVARHSNIEDALNSLDFDQLNSLQGTFLCGGLERCAHELHSSDGGI